MKKPLSGLKVACYYGCLLTRPPDVPELDCCEAPPSWSRSSGLRSRDRHLVPPAGVLRRQLHPVAPRCRAEALRRDPRSAKAAGADCIMVACPLCHGNLDIRQKEIEEASGEHYGMPVFYITQLVALAVGVARTNSASTA